MKKGLRRVAAVAVATLVAAPALVTVASATSTFAFDRLAGIDRYATSVAVAGSYGASTNVILASGVPGHYPDALTASYLAGVKHAPIMLTQLAATPANVIAQITASGATDVWLIGGTGVISAAQEAALDVKFGTIHRLGGDDRYLTAEKIMAAAGVAKSTTALLATGNNFPDALGAGPLSYVKGMPVALTGATLPAATLRALKAAGTTKVIALGGTSIVTAGVLAELATNGITLNKRIFGANRSETSSLLATEMITNQGFSNTAVNVASGYAFGTGADALGGAPLSGKENRPTLITESVTTVGPGPLAYLTDHAATLASGHLFGGVGAVSAASAAAMTTAARATSNQTYPVTPSTAASIALNATTLSRQYTVSTGAATQVDIQLYPAANVTTSAGVVTFADTNGDNIADPGSPVGIVSVVNGVANTTYRANNVTPVAGQVTFTIRSAVLGSVIPVVYTDDKIASTGDNSLNLVAPTPANALPKQPSEAFGIGGATTWVPATDPTTPSAPTITTPSGAVTVNAAIYTVIGVAEAGSTVTITGGSATATSTAAADTGAYSIDVHLTQNAVNTISVTATDAAGNTSGATTRAITEDSIPPSFISAVPTNGSVGIAATVSPTATYAATIDASSTAVLAVRDSPSTLIAGAVTVTTTTIEFNPTSNLAASTGYNIIYIAKDAAGNYTTMLWYFVTAADAISPTLDTVVSPMVVLLPSRSTRVTPSPSRTAKRCCRAVSVSLV